jgi:hypothetical protein
LALQEEAETFFARRSGSCEELTDVNGLYLAVHIIEPEEIAFARLLIGP